MRSQLSFLLRSAGLLAVALLATTLPASSAGAASAPRVTSMVVGKDRVLGGVRTVVAKRAHVRVGGRRCAVAAGTPLAVLLARGSSVGLRDHGRCGGRPVNSTGLYVRQIGPDRARNQAGWVYKVGRRLGTTGAADPSGPFGTGRRLRPGQPLLWFWCKRAGRCQRTLDVAAPRRVARNQAFTITVRGYDDYGRGRPIAGATVRVGSSTFVSDRRGRVTIRATRAGRLSIGAAKRGLVPAFPHAVAVR